MHPTPNHRSLHHNHRSGFMFGLLAGATLLITTWGIDGWLLYRADAQLPWVKVLLGAACVLLPSGALAWLATRLERVVASAVLWLAGGVAFGWVAAQISFRLFPWVLVLWMPGAQRFIAYDYGAGPVTRGILSSVFSAFFFTFAGLILLGLVESWSRATYAAGRVLPAVAWVGLFLISGAIVDGLVNRPLSTPIVVLDNLISFRLSPEAAMDKERARFLHAGALNPVESLLPRRHRLVVAGYDETISTVRVLADFEGEWAECILVETQPVFCRPAE